MVTNINQNITHKLFYNLPPLYNSQLDKRYQLISYPEYRRNNLNDLSNILITLKRSNK